MDLKDFIIWTFLIILILVAIAGVLKFAFNIASNIIAGIVVVAGIILGSMLAGYIYVNNNNEPSFKIQKCNECNGKHSGRDNFVGDSRYYKNYYLEGTYDLGKEKYPKSGSERDFELYKQYLKDEFYEPKMYVYPDPNRFETTYKTDIRNRDTVRKQKISRHDRHKALDNLVEESLEKQLNDYYKFYYNTF
jgi:hypothetical protein